MPMPMNVLEVYTLHFTVHPLTVLRFHLANKLSVKHAANFASHIRSQAKT